MKLLPIIFILIILIGCKENKTNNFILEINELQTHHLEKINHDLIQNYKPTDETLRRIRKMDSLDSGLIDLTDRLIKYSGGYKKHVGKELLNPEEKRLVKKFFYGSTYSKSDNINSYLKIIENWEQLFKNDLKESLTISTYKTYNSITNDDLVSVKNRKLFIGLNALEAVTLLLTVRRQLLIDKCYLLLNEQENER